MADSKKGKARPDRWEYPDGALVWDSEKKDKKKPAASTSKKPAKKNK